MGFCCIALYTQQSYSHGVHAMFSACNVIICFRRWLPGTPRLPPKAPGMDSITECSAGDKSLPTRPHQEHTTEFLSHRIVFLRQETNGLG